MIPSKVNTNNNATRSRRISLKNMFDYVMGQQRFTCLLIGVAVSLSIAFLFVAPPVAVMLPTMLMHTSQVDHVPRRVMTEVHEDKGHAPHKPHAPHAPNKPHAPHAPHAPHTADTGEVDHVPRRVMTEVHEDKGHTGHTPRRVMFEVDGSDFLGQRSGRVPLGLKNKHKRILVTGGAGFVGSHLVDRLIARGDSVIVVDNFFTGSKRNVVHHFGNPRFELIRHDVVEPILLEVDQIYHMACPASPVHYKFNPVKTIKTNVMGTLNMLGLAKRVNARFLITSTSEVYGDPLQHPQTESYWGNVNPIGVRSCYDEGKRVAETLTMDYHRGLKLEVRIARIFNTYGPRMGLDDGRVVSNFVAQALRKDSMTVYGDGQQTRSFQYVADLVEGLMRLMEGDHVGPFNLGNPGEFTMLELAKVVQETVDRDAKIEFRPNTEDDPHKRKPDISRAKKYLGWEPVVSLREGLPLMVTDFRQRIFGEQDEAGGSTIPQSDI